MPILQKFKFLLVSMIVLTIDTHETRSMLFSKSPLYALAMLKSTYAIKIPAAPSQWLSLSNLSISLCMLSDSSGYPASKNPTEALSAFKVQLVQSDDCLLFIMR
jgi:hypothetical protein